MSEQQCKQLIPEYKEFSERSSIDEIEGQTMHGVWPVEKEFIAKASPTKILDIGCGTGRRLFSYLSQENIDFVGIEKFQRFSEASRYQDKILVKDLFDLDPKNVDDALKGVDTITVLGGTLNAINGAKCHELAWEKIYEILPKKGSVIFDSYMVDGFETEDKIGLFKIAPPIPLQFFLAEKELNSIWDNLGFNIIEQKDGSQAPVRYYLLRK